MNKSVHNQSKDEMQRNHMHCNIMKLAYLIELENLYNWIYEHQPHCLLKQLPKITLIMISFIT